MANILLTTGCNLACAYCFAQEKMQGRSKHMAWEDVEKVLAFLKRSQCLIFRVMGGEPTLHPRFPDIVQLALQEGMRVDLLSNATWPTQYNDLFARIPPNRILFLLNVDHPDNYRAQVWSRIEHNLATLAGSKHVTLSFNIFEKVPRYEYIFALADRYGIGAIRMSFSLPVLGAQNCYLPIEQYGEMVPFIIHFVRQAEAKGISVRLDNAVPLCIFSYEEAGELLLNGVLDLKKNARCTPVVDIGPDLSVWCCFCLSKLANRRLDQFDTLDELEAFYQGVLEQYQGRIFPMDACYECHYRELWGCQGGCLAYAIMKHDEEDPRRSYAATAGDRWQSEAYLDLAGDVDIRRYDIPRGCYVLSQSGSGLSLEMDISFGVLLHLLDGSQTAEQIVAQCLDGADAPPAGSLTASFERQVIHDSTIDLLTGLIHQGFVVAVPKPFRASK